MGALSRLWLPARPPPIDSIHGIIGTEKNHLKNQQHLDSLKN